MKESATTFTYTAQRGPYLSCVGAFLFLLVSESTVYVFAIVFLVPLLLLKLLLLGSLVVLALYVVFGRLLAVLWTRHQLTQTHLELHYGHAFKASISLTTIASAQPVRERLTMTQSLEAQYDARKNRIVAAFSEQGQVLLRLNKPHAYKVGRASVLVETILINVDQRDEFLATFARVETHPSFAGTLARASGEVVELSHDAWANKRGMMGDREGPLPTPLLSHTHGNAADGDRPVAIRIEGLTRRFNTFTAVDTLSMSICQGEIYGFLGSNGAGKTTTLKMLVGLLQPNEGRAEMVGHDVWADPLAAKAALGYVADRSMLYERLTGREFLAFLGQLRGISQAETEGRITHLLNLLELTEHADRPCGAYSFGMKRKLSLAGALLHSPQVLILDEPLNGLDPRSARRLKDLFGELAANGTAILLSTHDLATAEAVCHRVGIIHRGRLLAEGSASELQHLAAAPDLEAVFLSLTAEEVHA